MGKGSRSSQQHAEAYREQQKAEAERASIVRRNRIIAVAATVLVLCALAVLVVRAVIRDTRNSNGYYMRNAVVMSTDKVEVNAAEMSYFIYTQANNFLSNYYRVYQSYYTSQYSTFAEYIKAQVGLDVSASLKTQYRGTDSWFDYFKGLAESEVKGYAALYTKAVESGLSLDDDDLASISKRAATVDLSAYGTGIQRCDVEEALKLKTLADVYKFNVKDGLGITETEFDTFYDKNYKDYTYVDYLVYTVSFGSTGSNAESAEQAKEFADRLAAAPDEEAFNAVIAEIAGEEKAENAVKNAKREKASYVDTEAMNKLFDRKMKPGETYTSESFKEDGSSGSYAVYMLTTPPYGDSEKTVAVRHILRR